jgi:GGDEF domain-containing protein
VAVDGWERPPASRRAARERAEVLATVTGIAAGSLRDIDVAVPFAEDRLVVLMPHTGATGGLNAARRLCARVRERLTAPAVTVTVGVASHAGEGRVSVAGLVAKATQAMAKGRAAGGDRAEPADPIKKRDRISMG